MNKFFINILVLGIIYTIVFLLKSFFNYNNTIINTKYYKKQYLTPTEKNSMINYY